MEDQDIIFTVYDFPHEKLVLADPFRVQSRESCIMANVELEIDVTDDDGTKITKSISPLIALNGPFYSPWGISRYVDQQTGKPGDKAKLCISLGTRNDERKDEMDATISFFTHYQKGCWKICSDKTNEIYKRQKTSEKELVTWFDDDDDEYEEYEECTPSKIKTLTKNIFVKQKKRARDGKKFPPQIKFNVRNNDSNGKSFISIYDANMVEIEGDPEEIVPDNSMVSVVIGRPRVVHTGTFYLTWEVVQVMILPRNLGSGITQPKTCLFKEVRIPNEMDIPEEPSDSE